MQSILVRKVLHLLLAGVGLVILLRNMLSHSEEEDKPVAVDSFSIELARGVRRNVFGLVLTSLWQKTPTSWTNS